MAEIIQFKSAKELREQKQKPLKSNPVTIAYFCFIKNGEIHNANIIIESLDDVYDTAVGLGYKPYTSWNIIRNLILKNPLCIIIGYRTFYIRNKEELKNYILTFDQDI